MSKAKEKIENPIQNKAFLIYFNLGGKRSLKKACQNIAKTLSKTTKKGSLLVKIQSWSVKFKWQERIQEMDLKVAMKAEEVAIKRMTVNKSKILEAFKETADRYLKAIKEGKIIPSAKDFKQMWEIARIELGKPIGQEALIGVRPSINIFLTKNEKVINVVRESQEKLRDVLEGDIKE